MTARFSALLATILLGACASASADYPSLAIRDAERMTGSAEAVVAVPDLAPPAPPSADLAARLAQLQGEAAAAHRAFRAAQGRTSVLVRAASRVAVGSESWAVATVALADLESSRSQAMIALADLDALYVAGEVGGGANPAVLQARDGVTALVAEEDAVLANLRGQIRS